MTDQAAQIPDRRLTTPRAAAVAGIVFAVFSIVTFSILNAHIPAVNADTGDWLETSKGPVTLALALIPFAGIAFLWFIGVQREIVWDFLRISFSLLCSLVVVCSISDWYLLAPPWRGAQ
jgi:hypothetical protein